MAYISRTRMLFELRYWHHLAINVKPHVVNTVECTLLSITLANEYGKLYNFAWYSRTPLLRPPQNQTHVVLKEGWSLMKGSQNLA